jgi:uncharacterized protein (DUF1330 family)
MRANHKLVLGILAGTAVGAAAIQGIHAQAKPPTYVVVAIRNITDAESYKGVIAKAPAALAGSGGRFVIRTDKITSLDGNPPKRFILLAFDSVEKAEAWHNSAAQKEVDAIRVKSSDSLSFIVEGLAN